MANDGQSGAIIPAFQCFHSMRGAAWAITISPTIITGVTNICLSTRNGAQCFTAVISQKVYEVGAVVSSLCS